MTIFFLGGPHQNPTRLCKAGRTLTAHDLTIPHRLITSVVLPPEDCWKSSWRPDAACCYFHATGSSRFHGSFRRTRERREPSRLLLTRRGLRARPIARPGLSADTWWTLEDSKRVRLCGEADTKPSWVRAKRWAGKFRVHLATMTVRTSARLCWQVPARTGSMNRAR